MSIANLCSTSFFIENSYATTYISVIAGESPIALEAAQTVARDSRYRFPEVFACGDLV